MTRAMDVLKRHGLLHEVGIPKEEAESKVFETHLADQTCSLIVNLVLFEDSINTVHWFNTLEIYRDIFSTLNIKENGKRGNFSWQFLFNVISISMEHKENERRTIKDFNKLYNTKFVSILDEDLLEIIKYIDAFCYCVVNDLHFKEYIYCQLTFKN